MHSLKDSPLLPARRKRYAAPRASQKVMTTALEQIQELEARIQQLRVQQLQKLKDSLAAARKTVADLEAEIAAITEGKAPEALRVTRTRMSSEEIRGRILKALSASPEGLSQKQIADQTGLGYTTVIQFLKTNAGSFKTTGALKTKRYFLR